MVDVPTSSCGNGLIAKLKEVLGMHPGDLPVIVQLVADGETTKLKLGRDYRVDGSPALLWELRSLLGPDAVRLVSDSAGSNAKIPAEVGV